MKPKIELNHNHVTPIFQQIIDGFERFIISGHLKEGDLLPSVRDFSVEYTVNPNTVSKAYQQLQVMNFIEPIRGLGLKVSRVDLKVIEKRKSELFNHELDQLIVTSKTLQISKKELLKSIQTRFKE